MHITIQTLIERRAQNSKLKYKKKIKGSRYSTHRIKKKKKKKKKRCIPHHKAVDRNAFTKYAKTKMCTRRKTEKQKQWNRMIMW